MPEHPMVAGTARVGCFLALDCLFLQRLMPLKLPNSPFQGSNRSISPLYSPEKTTASHDVAPEIASVVDLVKNSYIGIPDTHCKQLTISVKMLNLLLSTVWVLTSGSWTKFDPRGMVYRPLRRGNLLFSLHQDNKCDILINVRLLT